MLKSNHLIASKRLVNWASRVGLSRRTSVLAIPTFLEPVASVRAPTTASISDIVKGYWNRCASMLFRPATLAPVTKQPIENAILLAQRGPPSSASQGFIMRGRGRISDLRTYLFRNVYSDFSSDEKKWVWRLVAANAFSFLLWQVRPVKPLI